MWGVGVSGMFLLNVVHLEKVDPWQPNFSLLPKVLQTDIFLSSCCPLPVPEEELPFCLVVVTTMRVRLGNLSDHLAHHQEPCLSKEEHSIDQCRSRLKLSKNFERHWSILILRDVHMDQSLVHTFSWGNSYGPMVLKVLLKFPPTLVLVHVDGSSQLSSAKSKRGRQKICHKQTVAKYFMTFYDDF